MIHALISIVVTVLVGLFLNNWFDVADIWFLPAAVMVGLYWGREQGAAEYEWINQFGEGRRANMPWWGGYDPRVWDLKDVTDFVLPILGVTILLVLATSLGWT